MKQRWDKALLERMTAIPLIDSELIPRSVRSVVMTLVTAGTGVLIFWSAYSGGVARGMNHVIAYGTEIDLMPMSVALSDSVYNVHLGYVGLTSVYYSLLNSMNRNSTEQGPEQVVRNTRDGQLINEAIATASSLGTRSRTDGNISDGQMMTTVYHDLGSVDYMKLAFKLFGRKIEALYNTFFLILAVSSVLFLATFPNSISAQLLLLVTLFAFRLELHTPIFSVDMPTFAGVRHSSTLSLIPAWYFALLTIERRRLSWLSLALALCQLALLLLAITIRGTAIWTVVFLVALAAICACYRWIARPRGERTLALWLKEAASWPVLALIVVLTINAQLTRLKLHPVYFTDDMLPHHPVWHSAYVGLQYSPELYGFPVAPGLLGSDAMAFDGALQYLRSVHFIGNESNLPTLQALRAGGYFSVWNGGGPKWRLHDEIMRRVVLQIALKHPWKMIELYAWKKPNAIWNVSIDQVRRSERPFKSLILAAGVVAGLLWSVFGSRSELLAATWLVPVGVAAAAISVLPCVWAYPIAWSVVDALLLTYGTVILTIGVLVAAAYLAARAIISAATGLLESATRRGDSVTTETTGR